MTDLLDADLELDRPLCQRDGCVNPLPISGEPGYNVQRKYCDEHQPKKKKGKAEPLTPGDGEPTPPRVVEAHVHLGTSAKGGKKGAETAAKVTQAAEQFLGLIPLVMSVTGDEVCPEALSRSVPAIAAQLGELSKYHPGIAKLFTGGDGTGELFAWIVLVATVAPALIVVLVHHKIISKATAERFLAFVKVPGGE
ncbi:MAG: hypothetical protein KGI98_17350 [Euryarchaeota archaeon]|nr:hypothetical protein [Euryarchaeota archaeon]MDE1881968.1 hypothetical protein [Euryarchaeota archaeon]